MHVIALLTRKGGTGKSTLTCGLAVAASQAGETVLAVDCDEQGSLTSWAHGRNGKPPLVASLHRPNHLPAILEEARARFTVAFLDTAGRDDVLTRTALSATSLCLIPLRPTRVDAHGNRATVEACIKSGRKFAFVLNQCATTIFSPRAHEMAAGLSALGALALPMIGQRVDYQDSYAAGQGPTEYNPDGKAAAEMRELWQWIANEVKSHEH